MQHTCQKDDVVNLTRRARSEYLVLHGGIRLDSWMRALVHSEWTKALVCHQVLIVCISALRFPL